MNIFDVMSSEEVINLGILVKFIIMDYFSISKLCVQRNTFFFFSSPLIFNLIRKISIFKFPNNNDRLLKTDSERVIFNVFIDTLYPVKKIRIGKNEVIQNMGINPTSPSLSNRRVVHKLINTFERQIFIASHFNK